MKIVGQRYRFFAKRLVTMIVFRYHYLDIKVDQPNESFDVCMAKANLGVPVIQWSFLLQNSYLFSSHYLHAIQGDEMLMDYLD